MSNNTAVVAVFLACLALFDRLIETDHAENMAKISQATPTCKRESSAYFSSVPGVSNLENIIEMPKSINGGGTITDAGVLKGTITTGNLKGQTTTLENSNSKWWKNAR